MCLGTNMCGHNRVWAQSCLGTIVSGHNRVVSAATQEVEALHLHYPSTHGGLSNTITQLIVIK